MPLPQCLADSLAVTSQPQHNDIFVAFWLTIVFRFTMGMTALKDIQPRCEPFVQHMRVEDHVGGAADSDQPHQGDQADGFHIHVPQAQPERHHDERKLADLCHRQPG